MSFLFGLESNIRDSSFYTTEDLYQRVGENTGNLAFHHAIENLVGTAMDSYSWYGDYETSYLPDSTGLVPCANQVGAHVDLGGLAKKFKKVDRKLVAIGLGAQSGINGEIPTVPEGTLNWVQSIVERAPSASANIGVRGAFTQSVLDAYGFEGKTEVLGCPTLFINQRKDLGHLIHSNFREPKRIAVAAGHQRWVHLARIEQFLADVVTTTDGGYVGQSPLEMVKVTRGEFSSLNSDDRRTCRKYIQPAMSEIEFESWTRKYGRVFFDTSDWMEYYRGFDFVVGLRIHGVMLALQAGVPALCIAHDSRTLELCETMKVPYVTAKDVLNGNLDRDSLISMYEFDPVEFEENRSYLAGKFCNFLNANGVKASSGLQELAKG